MKTKTAILQVADSGPLESLVLMLRSIGYQCFIPNNYLKHRLRGIGCDTVLDIDGLVRGWGYEPPFPMQEVGPEWMERTDLYVDIKAHRNGPLVWREWPSLQKKTLWYRINGGKPEHVIRYKACELCWDKEFVNTYEAIGGVKDDCLQCQGAGRVITEDCGDEVNPPCPVLTPNQWYKDEWFGRPSDNPPDWCGAEGRAYTCWPPFHQFSRYFDSYGRVRGTPEDPYEDPICLIHNLVGWGYRDLVSSMSALNVKCYGAGSPDGLIPHSVVPHTLSRAVAYVHLKSSDAPGYALYEALAAACPVICTRRLIWRCRMQDLLIPGKTCLVFDRETHDGLTEEDARQCTAEVAAHLALLRSDPDENRRIGMNGYQRLREVMWSAEKKENVESLQEFFGRNFS